MKTAEAARESREKRRMGMDGNRSAIHLLLLVGLIESALIREIRGQPAGLE